MNVAFFDNNLVSKIDTVEYKVKDGPSIKLLIKRDDLIDPFISGNKWRKLKFNIQHAIDTQRTGIATFGGAYSNHIAATASAGKRCGLKTIGFIRTHKIDITNPTLAQAKRDGMELIPLTRIEYTKRHDPDFLNKLKLQYPDYYFVPEGGSNQFSEPGIKELGEECLTHSSFDYLSVPVGSGGTLSGLIKALPSSGLIGVAAVNDERVISTLKRDLNGKSTIHLGALCGGYAKFDDDLIEFCLDFFKQTKIPIEPVYSGKMFYAVCMQREQLGLSDNDLVLAIHTGGLQGIKGFIQRGLLNASDWLPILNKIEST